MSTKHKPTLEHARHNVKACKALQGLKLYNDWVITTAFYASLYYVCYELFPAQYDTGNKVQHCHDFADYYTKLKDPKGDKHSVREDLVNDSLNECYTSFST